jgi:hypothetical protein
MHELLTDKDRETLENVLVEVLVLAMKCPPHISTWITEIAVGIANALPGDNVMRAKEYATYRFKNQ